MSQIRRYPADKAGRGDDAEINVRAGRAKHTARRAEPISFILPIDDRYRLTADERCWRIEQRRKDGEWRPIEYHMTLEALLKSLSGRLLRTSKVRTLA